MFVRGVRGVVTWCSSRQAINSACFFRFSARIQSSSCADVFPFLWQLDQGWPRSLQLHGVQVKSPHIFVGQSSLSHQGPSLNERASNCTFPQPPACPTVTGFARRGDGWNQTSLAFSISRYVEKHIEVLTSCQNFLQKPYKVPVISSVRRWGPCLYFRWGTKPTL
jgi:hypothetical protein